MGLSALLVSTYWAMREPLLRGTSDRTGSTFSFICIPNLILTDNLGAVSLLDNNMKAVGILSALLLATCAAPAFAQISKEQVKERKLIKSSTQSELKQKASKVARKEAKKLYKPEFGISDSRFSCYARFPTGAYYICPPNNMDGKMQNCKVQMKFTL